MPNDLNLSKYLCLSASGIPRTVILRLQYIMPHNMAATDTITEWN